MLGPLHQLSVLHAAKLREGAIRRFITPDALRGGKHRVAAVAFLVVAIVLIAVNHHFIADFPALDFGAHRPDHTGGVRSGNVKRLLMGIQHGNRLAKRCPHTIIIDARRHHQNQNIMAVECPCGHHLKLHRAFRRAVTVLADDPCMHMFGHMAEGRDFAKVVKIFKFRHLKPPH